MPVDQHGWAALARPRLLVCSWCGRGGGEEEDEQSPKRALSRSVMGRCQSRSSVTCPPELCEVHAGNSEVELHQGVRTCTSCGAHSEALPVQQRLSCPHAGLGHSQTLPSEAVGHLASVPVCSDVHSRACP